MDELGDESALLQQLLLEFPRPISMVQISQYNGDKSDAKGEGREVGLNPFL